MSELKNVSIKNILHGKPLQRIDEALEQVFHNFLDERTSKHAKRKVILTIEMVYSKNFEDIIETEIKVAPVPAPFVDMSGLVQQKISNDGEVIFIEPISEEQIDMGFDDNTREIKGIKVI